MKKLKNFYTDIYSFFILKKNFDKNKAERIFSLLRVDTTFKTTSSNRMFDINQKLKKYIKKFFSRKIVICDLGVSSGQTTLELHNDLNNIKIKKIYGFDKNLYIKIYRFKKLIFLFSSNNKLLMVEYKKYCIRYRYFFLFKKIENFLLYLLKLNDIKCEKSNVLTPSLKKLDKCKFIEQNIFNIEKKYYNLFDVVRVSNLLNYSYFSESNLITAISNINKISKEKCIILVNRTTNKRKNLASFFIKKNGKFELLKDVNGGSEIKDLILSSK
jgi:hypothetical protein